jgi:hypothetical protein
MSVCLLRIKQPNSSREFIHFNYNKCLPICCSSKLHFLTPIHIQKSKHLPEQRLKQRMIVLLFCRSVGRSKIMSIAILKTNGAGNIGAVMKII